MAKLPLLGLTVLALAFLPLAHAPSSPFTVTSIQAPRVMAIGEGELFNINYTVNYNGTGTTVLGANTTAYWTALQIGSSTVCESVGAIASNTPQTLTCPVNTAWPQLPHDPGTYGTFVWVNGTLTGFGPSIQLVLLGSSGGRAPFRT